MILFEILVVFNLVVFAALIVILLWHKTPFFQRYRYRITPPRVEGLKARDFQKAEKMIPRLREASQLTTSSIDGDLLFITVPGFRPKTINLNRMNRLREMFSEDSATLISYHSFEILKQCVIQYELNSDERLIRLFWHAWHEWRKSFVQSYLSDYSWYDHCAAARFVNLRYCILVLLIKGQLSDPQYRQLMQFIVLNGDFLASDKRYDPVTNHGLILDTFLLQGAFGFPIDCRAKLWKNIAAQRSLGRIDHYISDDGVPLEGSTTYWRLIYNFYSKIAGLCRDVGLSVSDKINSKLMKSREFLIDTNINGKINRLGDSSAGNNLPSLGARPPLEDGYYLRVLDSGLVYLNALKNDHVVSQLMWNLQDTPPYVHRHQDATAIGLFHDSVFWFNSPGSYAPNNVAGAKFVKSHRNQSIVYDLKNGYTDQCWIENFESNGEGFVVEAFIGTRKSPLFRRAVSFSLKDEILHIKDQSLRDQQIVSQFLLNPQTEITSTSKDGVELNCKGNILQLYCNRKITTLIGQISYGRNNLSDTNLLQLKGAENEVKIYLGNGLSRLYVSRSAKYPYQERRAYAKSLMKSVAARIHLQRLKKIAYVMAFELAIIIVILQF